MTEKKETKEVTGKEATTGKETALTLGPTKDIAFGDIFDVRSNLEGVIPRLPQIKIAHQANVFIMPDEKRVESFEGYVLDTNLCNAWWGTSFSESGGGTIPDCSSLNGRTPDVRVEKAQSESCLSCELNKFGSEVKKDDSKGRGKACKNMRRIHIFFKGENLPKRLTLPPTSLRDFDAYATEMADKGLPLPVVKTKFSLTTAQNKEGIEYSELNLTMIEVLKDRDNALLLRKIRDDFLPAMRGQAIEAEETSGTATTEAPAETEKKEMF